MKRVVSILVLLGFFILVSAAYAEEVTKEDYYRACVAAKIAQCQQKAQLVDSKGQNLQARGVQAVKQAEFYQANGEELVGKMMELNVAQNESQVAYFIIKAYTNFTNGITIQAKK